MADDPIIDRIEFTAFEIEIPNMTGRTIWFGSVLILGDIAAPIVHRRLHRRSARRRCARSAGGRSARGTGTASSAPVSTSRR